MKKYEVNFYDEFHGNFAGYEIESDDLDKVIEEAEWDCSEYQWFEVYEIPDL